MRGSLSWRVAKRSAAANLTWAAVAVLYSLQRRTHSRQSRTIPLPASQDYRQSPAEGLAKPVSEGFAMFGLGMASF
jgi:hypothetical protein